MDAWTDGRGDGQRAHRVQLVRGLDGASVGAAVGARKLCAAPREKIAHFFRDRLNFLGALNVIGTDSSIRVNRKRFPGGFFRGFTQVVNPGEGSRKHIPDGREQHPSTLAVFFCLPDSRLDIDPRSKMG